MWSAFWKNCVGQQATNLDFVSRCKLLNRSVRPLLQFRNTRWPWTLSLSDAQNRVQRKMLLQFLRVERQPDEPIDVFNRRRFRIAADVAHRQGDWGKDHARRVCDWADHLSRSRNSMSLASRLLCWHPASWLQARRDDPEIGGRQRPGTRSSPGPVPARWDESSIFKARLHC